MLLLLASLAHAEDVYVSSNVKGAEIFLNGVATGLRTPATLTGVAPGTVEVSVEAGCARGSAMVTVQKGVASRVGLVAMAEDATITVNPDPVQARLFLDDQPYPGRVGAPLAVECGEHVLRAELDGYVASSIALELGGGEDRELTIELEELALATIDLSVQPRDATLTLDGKPIGTDAASLPSVAVGGHVFGAEYEGYKTAAIEVVVNEGEEQAWHFSLAGENGKKESTATQIRGPRPGLVVDASGPNAAKVVSSGGSSSATKATEDLDEPAPTKASSTTTKSTSTTTKSTSSTTSTEDLDEPAPTKASSTSSKAAETSTKSSSSKSSGGDYYSRLRTDEEGDGSADVEESSSKSSSSKSTSSSSSSSASKSTSSSSGSSTKSTSKATEPVDDDVPSRYDDLDEPAAATTSKKSSKDEEKAAKEEKPAKEEKAARDDDDGKSKVGLDVTGVTMMVLGAGSGAGAVYFWDRTSVAYEAYSAKVDAAEASGDKALEKAASDYYDQVLVPKRNMMYATAAGAGVLGVTGLVLVLVDDHLPMIAPLPQGGAMLSWGTRF